MRVAIAHETRYRFDRPVRLAPHEIRLRPSPQTRTPVDRFSLEVKPASHLLHWKHDSVGNRVARVVFQEPTAELVITAGFQVDLIPFNPFDFLLDPRAERFPVDYALEADNLRPYLKALTHGPDVAAWLHAFEARRPKMASTLDTLIALNQHVAATIKYVTRDDPGVQTCEATVSKASGSCRDSGWLLVQMMRRYGVAARFVSGYLVQLAGLTHATAEDKADDADRVDLHAWAEAYLPGAGWIGFDATSGLLAAEGHIPVAVAASPQGAAPIMGSVEPSETQLDFDMRVTRLATPARAD